MHEPLHSRVPPEHCRQVCELVSQPAAQDVTSEYPDPSLRQDCTASPAGLHRCALGIQATHPPLRQTCEPPQLFPFATFPLGRHTDVPVSHDVLPVLHGSSGVQLEFAVHAVHSPLLQTMLVPHELPLPAL
jgi:hypothetical protein